MRIRIIICTLLTPFLFFGCSANTDLDPVGAEKISVPDPGRLPEYTDKDGFRSVYTVDLIMCKPVYYALYTPADNLKLILAGANQSGEISGYKIMYNADGSVGDIIFISGIDTFAPESEWVENSEDGNIALLRSCMNDSDLEGEHFTISRDESGKVTSVGSIDVPKGFTAKYWIDEFGGEDVFWMDDIEGGCFAFFVQLTEDDKEGRSTVDYLYCNGRLAAELAYWNGTLIKALYYDEDGHFRGIKEERDADQVLLDIWRNYDYKNPLKWYLGTEWEY